MWFPSLPGLRVDAHMQPGAMIPPHYDSLLAKLIVHADTRDQAIALMAHALRVMVLKGVAANAPLHRAIMADPVFAPGGVDTNYLDELLPQLARGVP